MKIKKTDKAVLKKHAPMLRTLSRSRKVKRNAILNEAPPSLFRAIRTLHRLLVKGDIPLSNAERSKLKPKSKSLIRKIHTAKDTKRVVLQNGEGFSGVLRVVLPIIKGVLGLI